MSAVAARRPAWAARVPVFTALLGGALVAWVVTVDRMDGMDGGPGTSLGGLGWYVGIWVTMMAAMMLPSAAPMVLLFAKVSSDRRARGRAFVPTWVFVAGYLAAWTVYGLVAYGVYRLIVWIDPGFLAWDRAGAVVAGLAIVAAGVYELTPLKDVCLKHCRSPLHFLLHDWRDGRAGALRMGAEHGTYCVGCCAGLMLILFALGVMSLVWMGVVATVILVQKMLPFGRQARLALAALIVAAGVWVAAAPASVPGLVQPGEGPAMDMGGDQELPRKDMPAAGTPVQPMPEDGMGGDPMPVDPAP